MKVKQAVILAGGVGARLRPITYSIPKPMIKIHNKPFLEHLLLLLKQNGIRDVVLLLGYKNDVITKYFKDGSNLNISIKYSVGKVSDETGTRIRSAKDLLDRQFLLLYCDNYHPLNLKDLVKFHTHKKTLATVTVYSNKDDVTKNNICVGRNGIVKLYDRSRRSKDLNGVEIGFYIINRKIFDFFPPGEFSFEEKILPLLIESKELSGYITDIRYYSIGTPERIKQTEKFLRPKISQKKIPIAGPWITDKEVRYVTKAARDGWYEKAYYYVREFEEKFASYIGVKYAIATDSCTNALMISLAALDIAPGDEVIVPECTWISTAAVVVLRGAKPVFADIEEDTWCIDPEDVKKKITSRTKAVIPVHLYGHSADMDALEKLSKKHNLLVIEDAAESVGATYKGRQTGSFGEFGCFSFFGAKLLVTGEGGMITTNDARLYERAKVIQSQGADPKKKFWQNELGYKSMMSNIQAALGTAQLARIDELIAKKRKIYSWYKKYLGEIPGLQLNVERKGYRNTYWMTTIVLDKELGFNKRQFMDRLLNYNIESRPFFYPLTQMALFRKYRDRNPIAYELSEYGVNLPSAMSLTEKDIVYVCEIVKSILKLKV